MGSLILPGLALASVGFAGRFAAQSLSRRSGALARASNSLINAWANSKYYRGGFEAKMSRREAQLVLGLDSSSQANSARKVAEAHRRVIAANHPDRGGSPYMAAKINEARQLLMQTAARRG